MAGDSSAANMIAVAVMELAETVLSTSVDFNVLFVNTSKMQLFLPSGPGVVHYRDRGKRIHHSPREEQVSDE